jgi:hypothetical protein
MATLKEHERDCLKLLGSPFTEVHEWLDETSKEWPVEKYGTKHRKFRHTLGGIKDAYKKFGSTGAVAAIIHILNDKNGFCPTWEEVILRIQNGIEKMEWENG